MAYIPTEWHAGDPIGERKLMKIENELAVLAENLTALGVPEITSIEENSVTIDTNTVSIDSIQGILLYGTTTQNGTPSPDNPIDITPLMGYDTMTGSGSGATYSRSNEYEPSENQYYAIQIDNGENTVWIGTAEKIAPLYDGDTIDFITGKVTRNNGVETLAIASMNNSESYPGWKGSWGKYNDSGAAKGLLTTDGNKSSIGAQNKRVCYISAGGGDLYRPYGTLDGRTQSKWIELYPNLVIKFVLKLATAVIENVTLNYSFPEFNNNLTITSTGKITINFFSDLKNYIDGHSGGTPIVNSVNGKIGNVVISTSDLLKDSEANNSDFDISDINGNVIFRLANGGIQTRLFNSKYYLKPIETYSASLTYTSGTTNTITIAHNFSKGDKIYFHLVDNQNYYDYGKYASYYEDSTLIVSNRRGSNGYFERTLSQNVSTVSIVIDGSQYNNGQELTLYVYKINGEIKPKIITVAADGTGMFTTLKAAVESITNANSVTNPYLIEIYPGTYDTLAGYTSEQISSANIGGGYTQTSFVGLKITDGISLRGIGNRSEIILTASLSTSDYSSDVRGNISTLNIQGSSSLENLTILAENLRYCVHDDFNSPINTHEKRILRNLSIRGKNVAYAPYGSAYGAGMTVPRDYLIENCEFDYGFGIHNSDDHTFGCNIVMKNCSAYRVYFTDYADSSGEAIHDIFLHDCNFDRIELIHSHNDVGQHMALNGTGSEYTIIKSAATDLYNLGMITKHPGNLTVGTLVAKGSSGNSITATQAINIAYGVVVGLNNGVNYVQRCGYIASNRLGLSSLSIGDYITVNSSNVLVSGGTSSNAVGIVTAVDDDGTAFIKLLI